MNRVCFDLSRLFGIADADLHDLGVGVLRFAHHFVDALSDDAESEQSDFNLGHKRIGLLSVFVPFSSSDGCCRSVPLRLQIRPTPKPPPQAGAYMPLRGKVSVLDPCEFIVLRENFHLA